MRHAFMTDAEFGTGSRTLRDLELVRLLERRDFDLVAECRLRHVDGNGAVQVVILTLEEGMFLHLQHNVKISGRAAVRAGFTFVGEPQPRAIIDTRGYVDFDLALHRAVALAPAFRARRLNDLTSAPAVAARPAHRKEALLEEDFAAAAASGTGRGPAARFGALALTPVADFRARHLNLRRQTEDGILELDLQVVAHVFTALRPVAPLALTAEQITEAEEIAKNIAQVEGGRIETARATHALDALQAEAVISGPLLRIAQDTISFGSFFEFFFGFFVVRVAVRVKLQRQFPVSALDLLVIGFTGEAEHFVVISFRHGHGAASGRLYSNFDHGGPHKPAFEIVAFLKLLQNGLIRHVIGLNSFDGLVQIGVKFFPYRVHRLEAHLL